jgi:cyclic pyranopterin phosphate synthase
MLKAAEKGMEIVSIRLLRKEGGKSGSYTLDETPL